MTRANLKTGRRTAPPGPPRRASERCEAAAADAPPRGPACTKHSPFRRIAVTKAQRLPRALRAGWRGVGLGLCRKAGLISWDEKRGLHIAICLVQVNQTSKQRAARALAPRGWGARPLAVAEVVRCLLFCRLAFAFLEAVDLVAIGQSRRQVHGPGGGGPRGAVPVALRLDRCCSCRVRAAGASGWRGLSRPASAWCVGPLLFPLRAALVWRLAARPC